MGSFLQSTSKVERLLIHRDMLLSFQSDALTEPLLLLPDPLDREALVTFRKIQCLMGDRFSVGHNYAVELIKTANACDVLRDEIYLQLLKQLRGNSNIRSVRKGYALLAMLCESCPPSPSIDRYVRHALELHVANPRAIGAFLTRNENSKQLQQSARDPSAADDTDLQRICAEGLRALEASKRSTQNVKALQGKQRKSVFDLQASFALVEAHRQGVTDSHTTEHARTNSCWPIRILRREGIPRRRIEAPHSFGGSSTSHFAVQ